MSFSEREDRRFLGIADDRCSPKSQADTRNRQRSTSRGYENCGGERMSGTPWSEELDGKELHEALRGECDLESRGSTV